MSDLETALEALATRGWWTGPPGAGDEFVALLRRAAARRGIRVQTQLTKSGDLIAQTVDGLPGEEPWRGAAEHALSSGALTQMRLAEARPGTSVGTRPTVVPALLGLPLGEAWSQCQETEIELIVVNAEDLGGVFLSGWPTDWLFEQRWRVVEQRPQPGSVLEQASVEVRVARDSDGGGAGVREPRRPTPSPQSMTAEPEGDDPAP